LASQIVIIDVNKDRAEGEVTDYRLHTLQESGLETTLTAKMRT
jgi:hypothetical protein